MILGWQHEVQLNPSILHGQCLVTQSPPHWDWCSIQLFEMNLAAVRNLISVFGTSSIDRYVELFHSAISPLLYFRSKVLRIVPTVYELPKRLVTTPKRCFRPSFTLSSMGIGPRTLSQHWLLEAPWLYRKASYRLDAFVLVERLNVFRFAGNRVDSGNLNRNNVNMILLSLVKVFWSNLYVL